MVTGAILAGGAGRRIGGNKPTRLLAARPLVSFPIAALSTVCERVVVVAKPDLDLGTLDGIELWIESQAHHHPVNGITHALEGAGGPVFVCAADMPFVTPEVCRALLAAVPSGEADAVVAVAAGVLQPVFGVYLPSALGPLRRAPGDASLTSMVEALRLLRVAVPGPLVRSINTPEELAGAERELSESPRPDRMLPDPGWRPPS